MTADVNTLREKVDFLKQLRQAEVELAAVERRQQQAQQQAEHAAEVEHQQQVYAEALAEHQQALARVGAVLPDLEQRALEAAGVIAAAVRTGRRLHASAGALALAIGRPDNWPAAMPWSAGAQAEQFLLDAGIRPSLPVPPPAGVNPALFALVNDLAAGRK